MGFFMFMILAIVVIAIILIVSLTKIKVSQNKADSKWKNVGLWVSFSLLILFWALYLSLLLVEIGSPIADVLWLFSGISGIVFGILNFIGNQKKHIKVISIITLLLGLLTTPLWFLAMLIGSM